jgi:hypothetical protein
MAEITPDSAAASGPIHTATAGIAARLLAAFPATKFQHELLPAALTVEGLGKLCQARAPLVGLAFLGFKPAPNSGRILSVKLRFGVYLVTANPKSRPRLLGDARAPGLAQMMHAAVIALHGWTLAGTRNEAVGGIDVREADNTDGMSWQAEHMAAAALTLEVDATFTADLENTLQTIAATWTFDGDVEVATDTFVRPT